MKTSTLKTDKPIAEASLALALPKIHLNAEGLAELYSFLQYLQFKHGADLAEAIDHIEEELDILECQNAQVGNGERVAWNEIKAELGLV